MLFVDRPDGDRIGSLSAFDAIVPYAVRSRGEASVFFSKDLDAENAIAYCRQAAAAGRTGPKPSVFSIAIAAAIRTLSLRPGLNRFVHRRTLYQRRDLAVSFIVKRRPGVDDSETIAKIYFEPGDTLARATDRIETGIAEVREGKSGAGGPRIEAAHRLPLGKTFVTSCFRLLDRFNVAPRAMIRDDPLFTSIYFANLGSIGLDTPFHGLYEWGTTSLFVVMGRLFQRERERPERAEGPERGAARSRPRHYVNFKITADERIAEGIYFAQAAALFQRFFLHPELLEEAPGA